MTVLGSVFLGDAHHHRVFTTSPPTSPTPSLGSTSFVFRAQQAHALPDPEMPPSSPAPISSAASLELRLRWLEALLLGVRSDTASEQRDGAGGRADSADTLFRRAEYVQRRLDAIVASNDGLMRFMEHCACLQAYVCASDRAEQTIGMRRTSRPRLRCRATPPAMRPCRPRSWRCSWPRWRATSALRSGTCGRLTHLRSGASPVRGS